MSQSFLSPSFLASSRLLSQSQAPTSSGLGAQATVTAMRVQAVGERQWAKAETESSPSYRWDVFQTTEESRYETAFQVKWETESA